LEQSGVKYHLVKFSYSELWTVHELILDTIINTNMDSFRGIGVSEMDNTIQLSLKTDAVIPEYLSNTFKKTPTSSKIYFW